MELDLSGSRDGIGERFVPDQDRGRLIEAEHLVRYRWASQLAAGRRVLDAGCGMGYGSALLAAAGASEVLGVDLAAGVIEAVAPRMPDNVRLEVADLLSLPMPDDAFDLIVCFEVIEHMADPGRVLDELARVLGPDGVLLISSPNRGVFPPGNPHHLHEFVPEELRQALAARFSGVRLVRQQDYLLSAALDDEAFGSSGGTTLRGLRIDKIAEDEEDRELYTLALAGNGPLPDLAPLGVLTGTLEFAEWLRVFDEQTAAIQLQENQIRELEERLAERNAIAQELVTAEQRLAELPALRLELEDLRYELAGVRAAEQAALERLAELEQKLTASSDTLVSVMSSPSWKVTRPLRVAKRLLQR